MTDEAITWPAWLPHVLFMRKCPRCRSDQFKPAETRPYDALLALFGLRPVRCKFCWRRYYWVSLKDVE